MYVSVHPVINVPPPDASKKVITHGTDKYGEPNVTIETVPTTQKLILRPPGFVLRPSN